MANPPSSSSSSCPVGDSPGVRWTEGKGWAGVPERLAIEAPLAIEIAYERQGRRVRKVLAVTMRTPGADEDLAIGFLLGEGLIAGLADVAGGEAAEENARGEKIPTWRVELAGAPREDLERISRGLITSSACGLCGRPSLAGLPLRRAEDGGAGAATAEMLASLPERLRRKQESFAATGGSHGAGLFDGAGRLLLAREDVGRHNAVDKLMGAALKARLSRPGKILVLSGRASFELVQKASAAGIAWVMAVGAPSSLAVDLAHAAGITLVGFARGDRFTVYAHAERLVAGEPAAAK